MKQLFYASLFAATVFACASCNNGAYDANPATDNSGLTVPTAGSGNASRGQIVGNISGTRRTFSFAYYTLNSGNVVMQGVDVSNNINHSITLFVPDYKGPGTYKIHGAGPGGVYAELDAAMNLNQWSTQQPYDTLPGSLTVTSEAGNELKGTFYFKGYRSSATDNISVYEGGFDVPRQQ